MHELLRTTRAAARDAIPSFRPRPAEGPVRPRNTTSGRPPHAHNRPAAPTDETRPKSVRCGDPTHRDATCVAGHPTHHRDPMQSGALNPCRLTPAMRFVVRDATGLPRRGSRWTPAGADLRWVSCPETPYGPDMSRVGPAAPEELRVRTGERIRPALGQQGQGGPPLCPVFSCRGEVGFRALVLVGRPGVCLRMADHGRVPHGGASGRTRAPAGAVSHRSEHCALAWVPIGAGAADRSPAGTTTRVFNRGQHAIRPHACAHH
jgi:hypothetical protein